VVSCGVLDGGFSALKICHFFELYSAIPVLGMNPWRTLDVRPITLKKEHPRSENV
jgi:hypothetical protein